MRLSDSSEVLLVALGDSSQGTVADVVVDRRTSRPVSLGRVWVPVDSSEVAGDEVGVSSLFAQRETEVGDDWSSSTVGIGDKE